MVKKNNKASNTHKKSESKHDETKKHSDKKEIVKEGKDTNHKTVEHKVSKSHKVSEEHKNHPENKDEVHEKTSDSIKNLEEKKDFSYKTLAVFLVVLLLVLLLVLFLVGRGSVSTPAGNETQIDMISPSENDSQIQIESEELVVLARVNGEEINTNQIDFVKQIASQQGVQLTDQEALERVIAEVLLVQIAQERGFMSSMQEVEALISEQLALQNISLDEYKQQMEMFGVSYEDEIEIYQKQLGINNLLEDEISNYNIVVEEQEILDYYEEYRQNLTTAEVELPLEDVRADIENILLVEKQREYVDIIIDNFLSQANIEYLS